MLHVVGDGEDGGGEGRNPRLMSVKQVAMFLGRDRNTVTGWLDVGCPFKTPGSKERGEAWVLDIADVVRWLEKRAGEAAASRIPPRPQGGDEGPVDPNSKDEADRRKAWAQALRAELDYAIAREDVIRISDALAIVAAEYADVRQALDGLPAKLATELTGIDDPQEIMDILRAEIRAILESLIGDVRVDPEEREAAVNGDEDDVADLARPEPADDVLDPA